MSPSEDFQDLVSLFSAFRLRLRRQQSLFWNLLSFLFAQRCSPLVIGYFHIPHPSSDSRRAVC